MTRRGPFFILVAGALFACNAILGIDGEIEGRAAPDGGPPDAGSDSDALAPSYDVLPPSLDLVQGSTRGFDIVATGLPVDTSTSFSLEDLPRGVSARPPALVLAGNGKAHFDLVVDAFAPPASATTRIRITRGATSTEKGLSLRVTGPLDTTFGDGGSVVLGYRLPAGVVTANDVNNEPRNSVGIVVLGDGRIATSFTTQGPGTAGQGQPVAIRLQENGARDTTFGDAGSAAVPTNARGYDLALLDDGTLLLAAAAHSATDAAIAVATIGPTGAVTDAGVLNQGTVSHGGMFSVVPLDVGAAMGIALDDTLGATLVSVATSPSVSLAVVPVVPGLALVNFEPYSLVKDTNARFFAVGETTVAGIPTGRVIPFSSTGAVDSTWASGNLRVSADAGNDLRAGSPTDGGFVFAGSSASGAATTHDLIQLIRTDESGGLVDGGITRIRPRGTATRAVVHALVVEPDGHVLVGGYAQFSGARVAFLARFDAQGKLDTTFGVEGFAVVDLGGAGEVKRLVLQGEAVIAAVVTTSGAGARDVVLVRIKP